MNKQMINPLLISHTKKSNPHSILMNYPHPNKQYHPSALQLLDYLPFNHFAGLLIILFGIVIFMDESEVKDIDQALILLSLKADEVNSLKTSIKTLEKKHNIKLTDLQFRLDQEKSKRAELQRKQIKADEANHRQKEHTHELVIKLEAEVKRMNESLAEMQTQQRKKEREYRAAIFEERLMIERERENCMKLAQQIESLHRYFDPRKILPIIGVKCLEQMPSYIDLYKSAKERDEQVKGMGLQLQKIKADMFLELEQTFRKVSTYEAIMDVLGKQNRQLEESIQTKEQELEAHYEEIRQKKELLETVKEEASQQVEDLHQELNFLKSYLKQDSEEIETQSQSLGNLQDYQRAIEELERIVYSGQLQNESLHTQYEQKISYLYEQNEQMKKQLTELHEFYSLQIEEVKSSLTVKDRQMEQKEELILLLRSSIREQEQLFDQKMQQMQKYANDLNDLIRKKKKTEQEYKSNQLFFKETIYALEQQLAYIKMKLVPAFDDNKQELNHDQMDYADTFDQRSHRSLKRVRSGMGSVVSGNEPRNLLTDIRDYEGSIQDERMSKIDIGNYEREPNWGQMYYILLQRHNQFAKKVHQRLIDLMRR